MHSHFVDRLKLDAKLSTIELESPLGHAETALHYRAAAAVVN